MPPSVAVSLSPPSPFVRLCVLRFVFMLVSVVQGKVRRSRQQDKVQDMVKSRALVKARSLDSVRVVGLDIKTPLHGPCGQAGRRKGASLSVCSHGRRERATSQSPAPTKQSHPPARRRAPPTNGPAGGRRHSLLPSSSPSPPPHHPRTRDTMATRTRLKLVASTPRPHRLPIRERSIANKYREGQMKLATAESGL